MCLVMEFTKTCFVTQNKIALRVMYVLSKVGAFQCFGHAIETQIFSNVVTVRDGASKMEQESNYFITRIIFYTLVRCPRRNFYRRRNAVHRVRITNDLVV